MSVDDGYDGDELRALAVALDVLDPDDPDEWDGDAAAFAASVAAGRRRLEARGLARFSRDGSAVLLAPDADELEAFLAPLVVVEAWIVDAAGVTSREWYLGPEVTVVASLPQAEGAAEQAHEVIATADVFADIAGHVALRGGDGSGESARLPAAELPEREAGSRLVTIGVATAEGATRELQLLDAPGGLSLLQDVDAGTADGPDRVDVTPLARAEALERMHALLAAAE